MKRIFASLLLVGLLAVPAQLFGFSFVETVQDFGIDAPGYNYVSTVNFTDGYIGWLQTGIWSHTLSSNYQTVPTDYVVSDATLRVQGWGYSGFGGELVQVGGTIRWTGTTGWHWVQSRNATFNVTGIDDSYWNNGSLGVSLSPIFEAGFSLSSSVLSINYDEASSAPPVVAAPEPASMLLFGLGLAGAAVIRKRK